MGSLKNYGYIESSLGEPHDRRPKSRSKVLFLIFIISSFVIGGILLYVIQPVVSFQGLFASFRQAKQPILQDEEFWNEALIIQPAYDGFSYMFEERKDSRGRISFPSKHIPTLYNIGFLKDNRILFIASLQSYGDDIFLLGNEGQTIFFAEFFRGNVSLNNPEKELCGYGPKNSTYTCVLFSEFDLGTRQKKPIFGKAPENLDEGIATFHNSNGLYVLECSFGKGYIIFSRTSCKITRYDGKNKSMEEHSFGVGGRTESLRSFFVSEQLGKAYIDFLTGETLEEEYHIGLAQGASLVMTPLGSKSRWFSYDFNVGKLDEIKYEDFSDAQAQFGLSFSKFLPESCFDLDKETSGWLEFSLRCTKSIDTSSLFDFIDESKIFFATVSENFYNYPRAHQKLFGPEFIHLGNSEEVEKFLEGSYDKFSLGRNDAEKSLLGIILPWSPIKRYFIEQISMGNNHLLVEMGEFPYVMLGYDIYSDCRENCVSWHFVAIDKDIQFEDFEISIKKHENTTEE